MDQKVEQHIEAALAKVREFFVEAATAIEALKDNERLPATKLAEEIAKRHGMTQPQLYPTLKFLFDGYPEAEITRGAHGGIKKIRPAKTDGGT